MKFSARSAFSLIELIFVIVIIGVLSAVAIPQFKNLTENSKISAELATASSVQSALDAVHGEWITNTCSFTWGNGQQSTDALPGGLNDTGYPRSLDSAGVFNRIFKTKTTDWQVYTPCAATECYQGPSSSQGNKTATVNNKPEKGEYWEYNATNGTFTLNES